MDFTTHFDDQHRGMLLDAAERLTLTRGEYLLRRGEPGGDIYLVEEGTLEVVDSRSTPEVILAVIGAGAMVGELAFVDDSPRSADVRAGTPVEVMRWARDDLHALLTGNADLGTVFYQSLARTAAARMRRLTAGAVSGSITSADHGSSVGVERARGEARGLAEAVKGRFIELEMKLRATPDDTSVVGRTRSLLDELQAGIHTLFSSHDSDDERAAMAKVLIRELHPWLVRSELVERCIQRADGSTSSSGVLAHIQVNSAAGDGQLGEILDRWLLDRPMMVAHNRENNTILEMVEGLAAERQNIRVILVNAGTGSLIVGLVGVLSELGANLEVMDQSRAALAAVDHARHPPQVSVETVQESLAQVAMGRVRHQIRPADLIIAHGIYEYLPERLAISLTSTLAGWLNPEGLLIATAMGPSEDQHLLDRLLRWPTIRRSAPALRDILARDGLKIVQEAEAEAPLLVMAARRMNG